MSKTKTYTFRVSAAEAEAIEAAASIAGLSVSDYIRDKIVTSADPRVVVADGDLSDAPAAAVFVIWESEGRWIVTHGPASQYTTNSFVASAATKAEAIARALARLEK